MDINEHWYHSQAAVIETSKFYDKGDLAFHVAKERLIEHNEPLLRVRLTRLCDGGSVITVATTHMLSDGPSFGHFLYSWSNTFRNLKHDIPFFRRPSIYFSPVIPISWVRLKIFIGKKLKNLFSIPHGWVSFHITAIQLVKLQKKDRKNASEVLSTTRGDSLMALAGRCFAFDPSKYNLFAMPVNMSKLESNVCRPGDINHKHIYTKKFDNMNSTGMQIMNISSPNEAVNTIGSRYFGNDLVMLLFNTISSMTAQDVRRVILNNDFTDATASNAIYHSEIIENIPWLKVSFIFVHYLF